MSNLKYIRSNLEDTYGILELQDKILEIMVYIDLLCRENDIQYFLMGGSALGAIRHGGFIPWDDDLDIFMTYPNYMRFLEVCETKLNTDMYYLQKENTEELTHFFSKIRMNGTTYLEEANRGKMNMHQGIFVDIMCLNNAAPSKFGKKIQYNMAGLLKAYALTKVDYKTDSYIKKVQLCIAKIIVRGHIKNALLKGVRKYNDKANSLEVAHLFGRAKFENSFYPSSIFDTCKYVDFETVKLSVPKGVEEYLTRRFGKRYMEMPNQETRSLYQNHAIAWDTKKDYSEMQKNFR